MCVIFRFMFVYCTKPSRVCLCLFLRFKIIQSVQNPISIFYIIVLWVFEFSTIYSYYVCSIWQYWPYVFYNLKKMNPVYDIICSLLKSPFSRLNGNNRKEIVTIGRRTPSLKQKKCKLEWTWYTYIQWWNIYLIY